MTQKNRKSGAQSKRDERTRATNAGLKRLEFAKVPASLHGAIKKLVHDFIANWNKNKLDKD